ncbi:ABC transporter ATP-binding protein [Dongia sp.]|uniref:ABC transporter ATP-binding protein n=1 Tax=Dongia sp. TaxID=1977262 RepID=UPI0035B2E4E5
MNTASHLDLRDLSAGAVAGVLDGFSAEIARGQMLAVVSPEAASLRTLIDLIAGFARPHHGRILLDGKDLALRAPGERGFMSLRAHLALFPHLDARANIAFPLEQRGHDRAECNNRLQRLVEEIGIAPDQLGLLPGALDPVMSLRVALARALAGEPEVLLLERPLQSLPSAARRAFLPELKRLHRQFGITALLATDDLAEAMALADSIIVLSGGRDVQRGRPDELFSKPANAIVARLAGPCNLLPVDIVPGETKIDVRSPLLQSGGGEMPRERCHPGLGAGPALLLVRPEVVRPFLGIRRFDMLTDGSIVDVMPRGGAAQIRVAVDGLPAGIMAEIPLPSPFPLESGRRVTLGWNRTDSYLLPAEP